MVINIDDEIADQIVCENIKRSYEILSDPKFSEGMYSLDVYENYMRIHFLKEAMKRVYEYYSNDTLE
jgi:hypothetical protein